MNKLVIIILGGNQLIGEEYFGKLIKLNSTLFTLDIGMDTHKNIIYIYIYIYIYICISYG